MYEFDFREITASDMRVINLLSEIINHRITMGLVWELVDVLSEYANTKPTRFYEVYDFISEGVVELAMQTREFGKEFET